VFAHYVKDMKNQINEIKRMQQLAGLVNENINEMRSLGKWNMEDITPDELAAMDKVIKAGNDKYDAERNISTFRPAMYNNRPSITDGVYHYLFGKSKFASDHSSLYVYNRAGEEVASYDITDEWSSIKQDPTLLAAYKELDKQSKGVEEGIGSTLKAAMIAAPLAFGAAKDTKAQKIPQGIEIQTKLKDEEAGDKLWHAYSEHRSTINLGGLSPEVVKAISMAEKEARESGYPYDAIKKLGQAAKKDQAAMEIVNTDEAALKAASKDAIEAAKRKGLEEVVNEALRKFRKGK
jgi:hypothetical protein